MIRVDTSACIAWLIGPPIGKKMAGHLPQQADWRMPTMVQLELATWLAREDTADQVIALTQVCPVVPVDTDIALAATVA